MPGRLMSIRITSGRWARASAMPPMPSPALSRRMSGRRSISCSTSCRLAGLSSTYSRVRSPRAMLDRHLDQHRLLRQRPRQVAARPPESSSNQNTLPTPTVLSTPMSPPISSTSRLLTTRPMPVPSSLLASWPSRLNGWNSCAQLCCGQSLAGVLHTDAQAVRGRRAARHLDRSSRAVVFDRVGQQVDQHLLQAGPVGIDEARAVEVGKADADAALSAPAARSSPGIRA